MRSLQLREQLRFSQIVVNNGIEILLQVKGADEGYKLKVQAIEIERESQKSECKKKISESQRKRKKLNLKAKTFAKNVLRKTLRLLDAHSPFSAPPSLFDIFCCQKLRSLKQCISILRVFAF